MLTSTGFVTDAYLMVRMRNHWTSYYKWLQQGKWSWVGLGRQFVRLVLQTLKPTEVFLAIDDTLVLRASEKAPSSQRHHQHGNKPNLATFVQGQCWVSLAIIVQRANQISVALPLLSRLMPSVGNTGKLVAANTLIRAVSGLFQSVSVRVLVDSWYMRRVFIQSMQARGLDVIGQARIDTRLYDEPPARKPGQRGRPRQYGEKWTSERLHDLPWAEAMLQLYGREQAIRYRSQIVKARFLKGCLVRAVWCEFQDKAGQWKSVRLILSTDTALTAEQVIETYGLRWPIEPMFHQIKQAWGLKAAWQQTRQTLHRWVHLTMMGYGLIQLLSCLNCTRVAALCCHSPWRRDNPQTAGQIRKGLIPIFRQVDVRQFFRQVDVRQWWHPNMQKFKPPNHATQASFDAKQRLAA